jgi:hypothetical protein
MALFGLLRGFMGLILDSVKRSLWEELVGLINWWDMAWCIEGDFSVTHYRSD